MIKAADAIVTGRQLLGTPYSTYDCINYVKKIIRTAPGGLGSYQTAGTNTLWRSKDLTYKQTSIVGVKPGMLVFKVKKDASRDDGVDVHHIGLVTDQGTVLHSSSVYGKSVETLLDSSWHYAAKHKLIEPEESTLCGRDLQVLYTATVNTASGPLNMRVNPSTSATILQRIPKGEEVDVLGTDLDEWWSVRYKGVTGYAASGYLVRDTGDIDLDPGDGLSDGQITTTLINDWGMSFTLLGSWHIAAD